MKLYENDRYLFVHDPVLSYIPIPFEQKMQDALERTFTYVRAETDGIMIHSTKRPYNLAFVVNCNAASAFIIQYP